MLAEAVFRPQLAVVKLGGSLLTHEADGRPGVDIASLRRLGAELASLGRPLVVLHGTGSYGKPPAARHGYMDGRLAPGRVAIGAEVTLELQALECAVSQALFSSGLPVFRLPAASLFSARAGDARLVHLRPVQDLLDLGLVPLIGGGFVVDDRGLCICSSDRIATELAAALGASSLVMATRAAGVCRDWKDPSTLHRRLCADDHAALALIAQAPADVSGGMRTKVEEALALAARGVRSFIVDGRLAGNVTAALGGRPVSGTELCAAVTPPRGT